MRLELLIAMLLAHCVLCGDIARAQVLTDQMQEQAHELLRNNNIPFQGQLVVTRMIAYKQGGGVVSAMQLHDGLLVFDSELVFHFGPDGKVVKGQNGSDNMMGVVQELDHLLTDASQVIDKQRAIELFGETASETAPSKNAGRTPAPKCTRDPDSIVAELGVYQQKLSWRVKCIKRRMPVMFVDAKTGVMLNFNTGGRP